MILILWLLEKLGRKFALVDFYGDVQQYRYFVFYREDHFDSRWIAKLPNLLIHEYPGEPGGWGPDGPTPHSHPWNSLGVLVRGWYKEVINEVETRVTKAFGASYVPHTSHHRLASVEPGTISLFFHGFRQKEWELHGYECPVICDECKELNGGVCMTEAGAKPFNAQMDSKVGVKGWRTMKLIKVDSGFKALLADRKEALKRMGVQTPATSKEKLRIGNMKKLKEKARA
jgi:hypothetical protein